MIKNRNVDPRAGIEISKILGAGLVGRGKIFYAAKSGSEWAAEMQPKIDQNYFFNSSTAILEAVGTCVDNRNDVVIVGPGKVTESVITGIDKSCIKIIAAIHGWETQWRMGDAATKYGAYQPTGGTATQGFGILAVDRSIEIAGFLFDGGGGYSGVYVGDGTNAIGAAYTENSASTWVHHNTFRGGGEGQYGVVLDGCSADVKVEDNVFEQTTKAGIYLTPGGSRTCQRPIIRRNEFIDCVTYGIDMYNHASTVGILIRENSFSDGVSTTMTAGIRTLGAGVHTIAGNFFACDNPIIAVSTDWVSGNSYGFAGNTTVDSNFFGTEAAAGAES